MQVVAEYIVRIRVLVREHMRVLGVVAVQRVGTNYGQYDSTIPRAHGTAAAEYRIEKSTNNQERAAARIEMFIAIIACLRRRTSTIIGAG